MNVEYGKVIDLTKNDMECESIFIQYTANMSSAYLQSSGSSSFYVLCLNMRWKYEKQKRTVSG